MFTLQILSIGRGEKAFLALENDYIKRTRSFQIKILSLKSYGDDKLARQKESKEILKRLPEKFWLFALDEQGEYFRSKPFASLLRDIQQQGIPGIVWAIGGASGLDESIQKKAKRKISLSPFTLPHRFARLVLIEQLYRASTILRNEPYHK